MVTTVDQYAKDKCIRKIISPVIELVGPAGAGKTSLARTLGSRNKRIRIIDPPYFRKIEKLPFFIWNTLSLLPTFFNLYFHHGGTSPTRRHFVWMATLNGWHKKFHNMGNDHTIILLDQGPIFFMAQLFFLGPECLRSHKARIWQGRMYKKWAVTLDTVLFLDASDSQLMERIRGREKEHIMKKKPVSGVSEFLAQYRLAYKGVISNLAANNHDLKVLYFDTTQFSLEETANRILEGYNLKNGKLGASDTLLLG
jgi:shikimate kinase